MGDKQPIEIILEQDPAVGRLVGLMLTYSDAEFLSLVINQASSSQRRDIFFRNTGEVAEIRAKFSGFNAVVEDKFVDVRPIVISSRAERTKYNKLLSGKTSLLSSHEPFFPEKIDRSAHLSGAEFSDLAQVTIAASASAGGLVGLAKVIKDVAVKWLDNLGGRSLRVKVGNKSIAIKGTITDREIERLLSTLNEPGAHQLKDATASGQAKPTKTTSSRRSKTLRKKKLKK